MKKNNIKTTKPTQNPRGEVRIIAGIWRGRKLPVLHANGLRPTGDRVKETLFNWLMPYIIDSDCLDCFAGSGSLGFESLSRQAKSVTFIEMEKNVAQQLVKNLQSLKCGENQAHVINQNCLTYLNQPQKQPHFDIVFLDPPFHLNLVEQAIELLVQHQWLKNNALIYVETEKDKSLNMPTSFTLLKEKTTGQVSYRLYQFTVETI